jgi:Tol biopolymer transport system component
VATSAGGQPQQLTHDGLGKWLLVWSPDGSQIAFIRASQDRALAHITVISAAGKPPSEITFRPPEANVRAYSHRTMSLNLEHI